MSLLATLTLPPWAVLGFAVLIVLAGEQLVRGSSLLRRSNIPPPIVAGVLVAIGLLILNHIHPGALQLQGTTTNVLWLWPVLPQWGFSAPNPTDVERPFLILFFTCIGLNAGWRVAREGGLPLAIYLGLAACVAVLQLGGGIFSALLLGQNPLLGAMAGNVSLMGGFGTAAGFAPEFERAGLNGAASIGIAAAAFGVVSGGIVAGIIGGRLVEKTRALQSTASLPVPEVSQGATFLEEWCELAARGLQALGHFAILVVCMKLGAFLSSAAQAAGITFPVYMGAMIVAAIVRNIHDVLGQRWLNIDTTDAWGSVALTWLLAVVMIDLQLAQLANAALPMLVVLAIQVILLAWLSYTVVYRVMGRDYEAAVMSAGMIGFGLGATSNALATMRMLCRRYGPAPRAFLIVPIVGVFLIDFVNAFLTTAALNWFGGE